MPLLKHDIDLEDVDRIVRAAGHGPECLIPILQAIQKHYRYLPNAALLRVSEITDITPATIEGVVSFYAQFRRKPIGRHIISVCDGTACHVKGSTEVFDAVVRELELPDGEDTDADGLFTVRRVACLGCCTLAPALQVDQVTYGHVRPDAVDQIMRDFLTHEGERYHVRTEPRPDPATAIAEVRIGLGSCCVAGGSDKVRRALEEALTHVDIPVRVKHVSCVGMCHQTPLLEFVVPGSPPNLYAKVQPDDVPGIVARHFRPRFLPARILSAAVHRLSEFYADEGRDAAEHRSMDTADAPVAAFIGGQRRLATEYCGELDPLDIGEYEAKGGFAALRQCLAVGAENAGVPAHESLIADIERSGLRGRGGAGFPTARKWRVVRNAPGDRKFVICNGDEGDPGAFMDRMILESYPYRVLEGMLIASVAVGAHEGVCYIRAEYPLAIQRVTEAIRRCEAAGYLGDRVLGSNHALRLRIMEAAGAFVCGEETALIASVEGRRGMPAYRPPFPAERGLFGCPTSVNNVETYALIPWILRNGPEQFAGLGTEHSKGTKVFSLTGKVKRGGLIEVPMGVTIRRIVEEIGGGPPEGHTFKAVQVGGPSGGCVPAALADTPIDYEALLNVGAMMGSGGLVVLDDTDCMVEIARYFIAFMQRESCGKCTPCRVGTTRMLEILTRLCEGQAKPEDLVRLEQLARDVKQLSLCGLGKTAPNPVLTTLRYFRDEFEAHVQGRCPARACKALIRYSIEETCMGCTKCAQVCPVNAIAMNPYEIHTIETALCTRCDACRPVCPVEAIKVE